MPDFTEQEDRPKFFRNCPVCNTETSPGLIRCPNCGVDLEIARSNVMKGMVVEGGKIGYVAGAYSASTPPRKKTITFSSVIGVIIVCCILLVFYGVINDTILTPLLYPSLSLTHYAPTPILAASPTPIRVAPSPTPVPMGYPVRYGNLEIVLLDVITHDMIYTGDMIYRAVPGNHIIDLAVQVRNLGELPVHVKWSDVGILESNGGAWYANFGNTKQTANPDFDPFSISIPEQSADEFVFNSGSTLMRLIFSVSDRPFQTIQFQIEASPFMQFTVK